MQGSTKPTSFLSQLGEAVLRPAVVVAFVTTVFGSFSVSLASNYVTSRISDRQQQLELINTLMAYATDESLQDPTRLEAVLALVRENGQFDINVDGYGRVVTKLHDSAVEAERAEVRRLRNEFDQIQLQIAGLPDPPDPVEPASPVIEQRQALVNQLRLTQQQLSAKAADVQRVRTGSELARLETTPWANQTAEDRSRWERLGWTESNWLTRQPPPESERTTWGFLTPEQREAAMGLGYTETTWNYGAFAASR